MRWVRGVFVVYVVAVLVVTMWPSPPQPEVHGWAQDVVDLLARIGVRASVALLEALANVVMFVPFGLLGVPIVAAERRRWAYRTVLVAVTAAGFAFSAAIETTQLLVPDRFSTVQDVVMNGLGALVGAAVAVVVVGRVGRLREALRGREPLSS